MELFTDRGQNMDALRSTNDGNMADGVNVESVLQSINRHINCLSEENKNTRKRAIEGIRKETTLKNPRLESSVLQGVFVEIIKPILGLVSDPVEKCREIVVKFMTESVEQLEHPHVFLPYIIPVISQRLGQAEMVETSEELRLLLIQYLSKLVEFTGASMHSYLDDMVKILQRTIVDPYPEVKKASCKCAGNLAMATTQHFHMVSEHLIPPLTKSISHQHAKVRVEVINAIGIVLQYGNGKNVEDVVSHLAQRLFDQSPSVRKAVICVVGNWLLDLMDRYSFQPKLIPLLLTGITDEMPEIAEYADAFWHDVGLKYESEQEEDLKDKKNWVKETRDHYPPNHKRPNLGCRELVYKCYSKIQSGLLRDLHDWVVPTRVKAAQLLYTLLLNEEDSVTQHLDKLLSGLFRASSDEEKLVKQYVTKTAELVGFFVAAETWVKLVLGQVKLLQSAGTLHVLAAIIRGAPAEELRPYLQDMANMLTMPEICGIADSGLQRELLACVEALTETCGADCEKISLSLFTVLITVLALHREEETPIKVHWLLERLAEVQTLGSRQELFNRHTRAVISGLQSEYMLWTQHSVERLVFDTLLLESGPVVGEILEDVVPVLAANLHPDKEPLVRLKFFMLLSRLVLSAPETLNSQQRFGHFAVTVVRDMILPNCVWRAGKTAAAIRTTAISCLWALLQSDVFTRDKLLEVMEELMVQLRSTLDDDNKSTRLITCRATMHIFSQVGSALDQDSLHMMYPDLMKRLDDSNDDVRVATCQTFIAYFDCFGDRYDAALYSAHLEAIYQGLLVHLDDPEPGIQDAVLDVLKTCARLSPRRLLEEVGSVRLKHRTPIYLDKLVAHTRQLSMDD